MNAAVSLLSQGKLLKNLHNELQANATKQATVQAQVTALRARARARAEGPDEHQKSLAQLRNMLQQLENKLSEEESKRTKLTKRLRLISLCAQSQSGCYSISHNLSDDV